MIIMFKVVVMCDGVFLTFETCIERRKPYYFICIFQYSQPVGDFFLQKASFKMLNSPGSGVLCISQYYKFMSYYSIRCNSLNMQYLLKLTFRLPAFYRF
jgi:hypothetical protein